MELLEALTHHLEWKVRLRTALADSKTVEVESASDYHGCTLGTWLNDEARERFGHLESFRDCYNKHAHFHLEAGKVVQCIREGDADGARSMLGMAGSFTNASSALIDALKRLRQETE